MTDPGTDSFGYAVEEITESCIKRNFGGEKQRFSKHFNNFKEKQDDTETGGPA